MNTLNDDGLYIGLLASKAWLNYGKFESEVLEKGYDLKLREDLTPQSPNVKNLGTDDDTTVYEVVESYEQTLEEKITVIDTTLDSIERNTTDIDNNTDNIETLQASTNTKLDTVNSNLDSLETKVDTLDAVVDNIYGDTTSIDTLLTNAKDPLNTALASIDVEHYEIHEGNHYLMSDVLTITGSGSALYTLLVGAKPIHFVYSVTGNEAGVSGNTYENVVANNDGTLVPIHNNNRVSTNQSTGTLRLNPTGLNTTGSTLLREFRAGTGGTPATRASGSVSRGNEVILKANTKYSLSITNLSSSENHVSVDMAWYEL